MLENIEAIIFDLDGTLVDSMWVWTAIDDEFLGKYGLTQPEAYEKYANELILKKGAFDFLQEVHQRGIKLGIATSNKRELAEAVLRSTKVLPLFDSIWTSCEAKAGKPAPDVYLRVAQSLQVEPKRCLVFEDVPNGILAGVNAGMKVCAVEDDFSKNQDEKKRALADYYIKDYEDIKNNTYEVLK